MTNQEIFDVFTSAGMTAEGACAVIANYAAESTSNLIPNQVEFGRSKLTNEQYTAAVDNGLLDFRDGVGFGLAQWTLGSRKAKLLQFAKACGTSVGDGNMQLQFTLKELREDFHTIWADLCKSHDLYQLTKVVLDVYENPAVHNIGTRYAYAQQIYAEMSAPKPKPIPKDPIEATFPPNTSVKMIQFAMYENGYWPIEKINGYKSKEFFAKLREFTNDMEAC